MMQYVVLGLAIVGAICILVGTLGCWLYNTFDPFKNYEIEDPLEGQLDLFKDHK